MPTTQNWREERATAIANAKAIVARAKADNRDLTTHEQDTLEDLMNQVKSLDKKMQGKAIVDSVIKLGSSEDTGPGYVQYLSLRTPRFASALATRFGQALGVPGMKALVDTTQPYTTIPMDPTPHRLEQAPTSFLESLPAVTTPVVHRYMKQTSRTNNAAPVAPGAVKPTSVFGLEPVDGRLRVIAHVSEAFDKFVLQDGPSLAQFVHLEMVDGLHQAVESQLLSGDGVGENITGIANVSGIQLQAFTSTAILTARAAVTKVEVLGYTPSFFVLNPTDWEAIETTQTPDGEFILNSSGSRNGVPVDSASRQVWGVSVTVSTGVPAGTGYLLSNGVAQVATDGRIETEWSSAIGDDFSRNQVRARCEGRFYLAVTRPSGVVKMTLTGA